MKLLRTSLNAAGKLLLLLLRAWLHRLAEVTCIQCRSYGASECQFSRHRNGLRGCLASTQSQQSPALSRVCTGSERPRLVGPELPWSFCARFTATFDWTTESSLSGGARALSAPCCTLAPCLAALRLRAQQAPWLL
ncbi:hypothetical protein BV20DRAFT_974379 [Pilatotrama ljubarskyi]|nr:hypothetical protein BV20DRAFT_975838 [Pilatotrama ljubarskyi]KAI0364532.1 hypothetical protein BV20DRAFT_974379 [Pilatotrama ljubarskyi]